VINIKEEERQRLMARHIELSGYITKYMDENANVNGVVGGLPGDLYVSWIKEFTVIGKKLGLNC